MAQALDPAIGTTRTRSPKGLLALRGERHLVARLHVGDEAAFEVLYDRYAPPLLSFCRHMLGRTEEAEDAVQQVFASALSDLQRNQRELELKPWLYAIARNRCLSMLRARREHPDADLEPSTEGLQEQVQTRADLRQLVADLAD
ncbi:MAG TPA: sigma-70 family RNA polymerase sigma factor, partial [Thermoleophilaceae bacterium]|nr:sigma-70 family RNA polymerase sigma factor [Thermoleophilaceae bacterium]